MSAGFRGRREDLTLLTGQGKYTSDWNLPGQLHGYFVRSDRAHADQDAAEKIEVEYRDLPVVTDAEAALAPGAEQLYAEIPGNLCFDYEYGDEAKTDEAFSRAAHVTRVALDSQRVVGNPMEPKA